MQQRYFGTCLTLTGDVVVENQDGGAHFDFGHTSKYSCTTK